MLLPALATAGALAIGTLWYMNQYLESSESKEREEVTQLLNRSEELAKKLGKLSKDVQGLVAKERKASETDEQLKEFSSNLAALASKDETKLKLVRIGTRDSELAMWQAKHVESILGKAYNHVSTKIVGMKTLGDKDLKSALSTFSNKGVFTKELDAALLLGEVDIAVHSMKDLPTTLESGLSLGCVLERGTIEDAVVLSAKHKNSSMIKSLATLPAGSVLGTSALRRRAVLLRNFPDLVVKDVRGNLQTRLRKLDDDDDGNKDKIKYDALILARTGLQRCKLEHRISEVLDCDKYGHAVSQGALAVVCRSSDGLAMQLLRGLNHIPTRLRVTAERALLRTLEGGCKVPIAVTSAYNESKSQLRLKGWVVSLDGKRMVEAEETHDGVPPSLELGLQMADKVGVSVGEALKKKGAEAILIECRGTTLNFEAPTKK